MIKKIYTTISVRKIFDRLAHSSIMRLNKQSMDKLYDLMCMGFKYQLLSISSSNFIIQITLNHLLIIKNIIIKSIEIYDNRMNK